MNIQTVTYKINGINGLLMHNIQAMALKKPAKLKHEEWENDPACFAAKMYTNADKSSLIVPYQMLLAAIKVAAQRSGMKQQGKRSTYANVVNAVVFKVDDLSLNVSPNEAEADLAYVKVGMAKVLRKRPLVSEWGGTISFQVETDTLPLEVLDELLKFCGQFIGIGDRRPLFGRFEANRVK